MQREIEAEREACAKVCDEIVARYRHADDAPEMVAAKLVRRRRARKRQHMTTEDIIKKATCGVNSTME